ncbi:hypothetical protein GCM10009682_51570 [Luedemannella flava]|uniref:Lipoprotein n=1 Tax=Luedemannella flava TaxID=349316 RepID=A0ABN2MGH6_9ACTN
MAGAHIRRRRATATALAVLAGFTLAACGGGNNTTTGATPTTAAPTGDPGLGGGPTASATPSATSCCPNTGGGGGGGNNAPTYPNDAKAYARAAVKAWMAKDYTRLGQLGTPAAVQQVKDSVTYGGLPANSWHVTRCEGAAGSTYCVFINDNGDVSKVRVINQYLGAAHAVSEIPLERTEYRTGAAAYVRAFLSAWQDGNTYRMIAYASADVVGHLPGTPLSAYELFCDGAAGSTYVQVNEGGNASTPAFTLRVNNEKANTGAKHAITEYLVPQVGANNTSC